MSKKITITGNDTMQFDLKTFEVNAGEKVEFTFKNIGKIPKIAMGHNLVILKKGISAIAFGQKAMGAGKMQQMHCLIRSKEILSLPLNYLGQLNLKPYHLPHLKQATTNMSALSPVISP